MSTRQSGARWVGLATALAIVDVGCYSGLDEVAADHVEGGDGEDSGDGAASGGSTGEDDDAPADPDRVALSGLRRLSGREYDDTVRDLLFDPELGGSQKLPSDSLTPFDNDYRSQIASQGLIEPADFLAALAASRLMNDPERRDLVVGCIPSGPDDEACMRDFVTRFGRLALRRPLTEDEITKRLHGSSGSDGALDYAIEAGDFHVGVDSLVRTLLQAPEFLYRVEIGTPVEGQPGVFALSDFEVATRLSYFLWGSTPDDALLDRAEAGMLGDADGVRAAATDMLADPRAIDRVARFHALWLGYSMLPHPKELSDAMQAETRALIERVVFVDGLPWQDLFRFGETFVSNYLAEHYGLPLPGSDTPQWIDYGDSGRRGLLSHGSFLGIGGQASELHLPIHRGKFVRTRLFCEALPAKPDDVVEPPIPPESFCKPDVLAVHRNGGCAGCHALMDPVGFGLDNYDRTGRYRTNEPDDPMTEADESQCVIEGKGELAGIGEFSGPAELADLALSAGVLSRCATDQLYRFVVGHSELDDPDRVFVEALRERIGAGDFQFDALMLEIVTDDAFRFRREEDV